MAMQLENPGKFMWKRTNADFFWGEIAPCDHILQLYTDEEQFLNTLTGFVRSGLENNDGVILIATEAHLNKLHEKLNELGMNPRPFFNANYFPLDAHVMLSKFMVNGWPDESLFMEFITGLMKKVRSRNRKIRAFGEMVAVLWENGDSDAAIELEKLWNKFSEKEMFCLFCAYPQSHFSDKDSGHLGHICSAHSKILAAEQPSARDIIYSRMLQKSDLYM